MLVSPSSSSFYECCYCLFVSDVSQKPKCSSLKYFSQILLILKQEFVSVFLKHFCAPPPIGCTLNFQLTKKHKAHLLVNQHSQGAQILKNFPFTHREMSTYITDFYFLQSHLFIKSSTP